ncbi:MAG: hypothetical protein U0169_18425 [Polyangiaceae bacterium]
MKRTRQGTALVALGLLASSGLGCKAKENTYESAVQIMRKEVVETEGESTVTQIDFEVEWDACPGDQFQVIRGGKDFAACTTKYEVGDYVPVLVRHWWDERGFYRWDIERLGECTRNIEPESVGSYEKGQECRDVANHGLVAGFECSRKPFRLLVQRCPWMARE